MFKIRKTAIGLDISDHTIEVVELQKTGGAATVLGMGALKLPPGIVEHGRIVDKERLKKGLKKLFSSTKPKPIRGKYIIFGIPESQVYTQVVRLDVKKKRDIEKALPKAMQGVIPLPLEDTLFSYSVVKKTADARYVLVVATSKQVVEEWKGLFQELGFDVEGFDVESLALFRDLYTVSPKFPICVVDIGSTTTHVSLFHNGGLLYSRIIHSGGDVFRKVLATAEGVSEVEAEELLHTHGLHQKSKEGKKALSKEVIHLLREVYETVVLFEKYHKTTVTELALVGGTAQLKGLVDYVNKKIKKPTRLGRSVLVGGKLSMRYIEAVGLAWRGVDKKWNALDPYIPLENEVPLVAVTKKVRKKKRAKEGKGKNQSVGQGENDNASANVKKIILLISIIIFGGGLVFGAFVFREKSRDARREPAREAQEGGPLSDVEAESVVSDTEQSDGVGVGDTADIIVTTTPATSTTPDIAQDIRTVRILETGIGTLNVRSEPGIGSPIVTTVEVGEQFTLIEESVDGPWSFLQIDDETSGWVSSRYVEKIAPVDS